MKTKEKCPLYKKCCKHLMILDYDLADYDAALESICRLCKAKGEDHEALRTSRPVPDPPDVD